MLGHFRRARGWRSGGRFAHADFCPVPFERDFVHHLIDEIDSAAVGGVKIFSGERIRHGAGDEALSRIAYHDHHVGRFGVIIP